MQHPGQSGASHNPHPGQSGAPVNTQPPGNMGMAPIVIEPDYFRQVIMKTEICMKSLCKNTRWISGPTS